MRQTGLLFAVMLWAVVAGWGRSARFAESGTGASAADGANGTGATTRKGQTVFVHVLDWPDATLTIPQPGRVKSARALKGGALIPHQEVEGGLLLQIPPVARDQPDTVIALELAAGD